MREGVPGRRGRQASTKEESALPTQQGALVPASGFTLPRASINHGVGLCLMLCRHPGPQEPRRDKHSACCTQRPSAQEGQEVGPRKQSRKGAEMKLKP